MPRKFYKEDNEPIPAIKFEVSQPTGFTEITDAVKIKQLYIKKYNVRIEDGKAYILDFTADRYIDVLNGIYTEAEAFVLEAHIKDLYAALNNGWWLTAQNINSNLTLDGIYDAAMKSSIQTTINTYVADNY